MEKTLIIFKPDAIEKKRVGLTLTRFEKAGYEIVACKMMQLTDELLAEHYSHIKDKPFYPPIAAFMKRTPVIVMVLQAENAIERTRLFLGATDSSKAMPGTIRGDWGVNQQENIIHASDSPENAKIEINRFFKKEEIYVDFQDAVGEIQ